MGFNRAACHTCRQRHIKCDEAQPVCRKCATSGRPCSWVSSVVILDENNFASRKTKRPRGPRPRISSAAIVEPEVSNVPLRGLKAKAVEHHIRHQLTGPPTVPDLLQSVADDLLTLWLSRPDPLIRLSLSAMALAVYARIHNDKQAAIEASESYDELLKKVQDEARLLDADRIDAWLLAVNTMSRYEDTVYTHDDLDRRPFPEIIRSAKHMDGAFAFLTTWNAASSQGKPSQTVKHVRRSLLRSLTLRSRAMPQNLADGAVFGEEGIALEFDRCIVRIIQLRDGQTRLKLGASNVDELLREGQDIDDSLQRWTVHYADTWTSLPSPTAGADSITKSDWAVKASTRCAYNSMRALLNFSRVRIINSTDPERRLEEQKSHCTSIGNSMTDELLSSATQYFSDIWTPFDQDPEVSKIEPYVSNLIIWPLITVSAIKELDLERKRRLRKEIARMGQPLGVGLFCSAVRGHWVEV